MVSRRERGEEAGVKESAGLSDYGKVSWYERDCSNHQNLVQWSSCCMPPSSQG